tara:strand:+ start:1629 stop:1973 length:345 start_codon:yes stop_codon:yes gene_type:complete
MSIRNQLLALKIPTATVKVAGIEGLVSLRGLSASERDLWEQGIYSERDIKKGVKNIRASLVVRCLTDEAGVRLFTDSEIAEVGAMPASVIDKLYEHCQRLSGLGVKDAEELEKN